MTKPGLNGSQPDVLVVVGDIADQSVADRMIAERVEQFGCVDILVNNLGVFIANPYTDDVAGKSGRYRHAKIIQWAA